MRSAILAALAASMVAACATTETVAPKVSAAAADAEAKRQAEYVLERRTADFERVYQVGERVRAANVDLCPSKAYWAGIRIETINDYSKDLRKTAREVLAISEDPKVTWVAKGGPADKAGVSSGDIVVAVNGRAVEPGPKASRTAGRMIRTAMEKDTVALTVNRGGARQDITITPVKTCGYAFSLVDGGEVNAYADGDEIFITRGILRFVESDDELALVVGHELAHNAMGHMNKKMTNSLLGTLGGAVIDVAFAAGGVNTNGAFSDMGGDLGAAAFSKDFETEADYVGLYFMARAGFNVEGVEDFWRRMATEDPKAIKLGLSHPTTAIRYTTLTAAQQEIKAKLAAGEELKPLMKKDQPKAE